MEPLTVMVLSGLYSVRSWRLHTETAHGEVLLTDVAQLEILSAHG